MVKADNKRLPCDLGPVSARQTSGLVFVCVSPQSAERGGGAPSDQIRLEELLKEFPELSGSHMSVSASVQSSSSSLVWCLLRHAPEVTQGGCERLPFINPEDAGPVAGVSIRSANAFTSNAIFFPPSQ